MELSKFAENKFCLLERLSVTCKKVFYLKSHRLVCAPMLRSKIIGISLNCPSAIVPPKLRYHVALNKGHNAG